MKNKAIFLSVFIILIIAIFIPHKYLNGDFLLKDTTEDITCIKNCELPKNAKGKLTLFILAGQSNMSGRGELSELPPTHNSHPRAFVFANDYQWKPASEPIDNAFSQRDKVSMDKNAGVSPAMEFAITLLNQNPDLFIGFVPCAKGGTVIGQWQRNLSTNSLYGSCLQRAKEAMKEGELAAILFSQGESDARDPLKHPNPAPSAENWGEMFTNMINDFRMDIGIANLPIIYAQIGSHKAPKLFTKWDIVRQQQQSLSLPNVDMIKTDDFSLKDYVHYTTKSYMKMGQRYAEKYKDILTNRQN